MDSLEQELRRRLITVRELRPEAVVEADRALYEYQLKLKNLSLRGRLKPN